MESIQRHKIILDEVYKELSTLKKNYKDTLRERLPVTETVFFDLLDELLLLVQSDRHGDALKHINDDTFLDYFERVKTLVYMIDKRIEIKSKQLFEEILENEQDSSVVSFLWPTNSVRITSFMGENHPAGIDIGGTTQGEKEEVKAIAKGRVIVASLAYEGSNSKSSYVIIEGDDGLEYRYVHMDIYTNIVPNSVVNAGQPLGMMSDRGCTGQIHLHLEVRDKSNAQINPLSLFPNIEIKDVDNNYDYEANKNSIYKQAATTATTLETTEITLIDGVRLGNWSYIDRGMFLAKRGASLGQLNEYLPTGVTYSDCTFMLRKQDKDATVGHNVKVTYEIRTDKDYDVIDEDGIVYFSSTVVAEEAIRQYLNEKHNAQLHEYRVNVTSLKDEDGFLEWVRDAGEWIDEKIEDGVEFVGGLADKIVDVWQNTTDKPSAEEIQARLDNLAEIQNRVINAPMYYENAGGPFNLSDSWGLTWCNQATFDVANTTGFSATALYGEENRWNVNANEAVVNLNNAVESGLITSTTDASVAQDLANQGYTVIVGRSNNSGSGHLATVRDGELPQGSNQGTNVIHVGSGVSGNRTTAESFGANALVTYYYDLNQTFGSNGGEIGLDK